MDATPLTDFITEFWMERALALAALGRFTTSPNPMVGAVVLDADGQLVGDSVSGGSGTTPWGSVGPGVSGSTGPGGSLYVTLEPCCHHGRTPPCIETVLAAGIRPVVVAMVLPRVYSL